MAEKWFLTEVPRRKRRFYRDHDQKLIKHLSKQVKKADIKEIEKQKIILSLKRQLESARQEELQGLAAHLFEQRSEGRDNTKELVTSEVHKYREMRGKISGKEADEIAESIYAQLKEERDAQHMYDKLARKREKKDRKKKRSKDKELFEKRAGLRGSKRREAKELGVFGLEEPEKVKRIEPTGEADKIKDELSLELGLGKEEDETFGELEKMNEEAGSPGPASKDEFSMAGFDTDLGGPKKKKKKGL